MTTTSNPGRDLSTPEGLAAYRETLTAAAAVVVTLPEPTAEYFGLYRWGLNPWEDDATRGETRVWYSAPWVEVGELRLTPDEAEIVAARTLAAVAVARKAA